MRPKKLTTVLENIISEIEIVYNNYIDNKKELDSSIRLWVQTYVNDIEHKVIESKVAYGTEWRFKGLSYPVVLQEEDLNIKIKELIQSKTTIFDRKSECVSEIIKLTTSIKLNKEYLDTITEKLNKLVPPTQKRVFQEWDNLIETYRRLPDRFKSWTILSLPLQRSMFRTFIIKWMDLLKKPITSKEYIDWSNQLKKMLNNDVLGMDGKRITTKCLIDMLITSSHIVDNVNELNLTSNIYADKLEVLEEKLKTSNLELCELTTQTSEIDSELENAYNRRSRLNLIKENDELYADSKNRAVTVITSYIVQDYDRSLIWLENEGAAELVSKIETLILESKKFNLLESARIKLEKEIEIGSDVSIIQTAIKEKDIFSTAMYLTNSALSLNI